MVRPPRLERDTRRDAHVDPRSFGMAAEARGSAPRPRPELVDRVFAFFTETVWAEDRPRKGLRALFYRVCRIGHLTVGGFIRDEGPFRASALTYITVLSLVPLLAFSFSVAKGFGFYQQLVQGTVDPFLDRTFGPLVASTSAPPGGTHEVRVALARLLEIVGDIVEETRVTSLGAFGLVILGWAVIKLLGTIERAFNRIWGVQRPRSLVRKVSDYLTMVIVTPIFLITAAGLTAAAQDSGFVETLRGRLHLGPVLDLLVRFLPLLSLWIGFTFVYMAMPNARTRFLSAIVGALVGGTLWWLVLLLHVKFQVGVARYSAIYASFAAIPIFLIWVNISWMTVLFGAEVCFAHQSEPSYLRVAAARPADHAFLELLALRAMSRIGERFLSGGEPWTTATLSASLAVPPRPLEQVLGTLEERGLLATVRGVKEAAFLPSRDLDSITVKSVIDALKGSSGPVDVPANTRADKEIDRILEDLNREAEQSKSNATLRTLAEAALRAEEREKAGTTTASSSAGVVGAPEMRARPS